MTESKEKSAEKRRKRSAPLKFGRFRHSILSLAAAVTLVSGGALMAGAVKAYAGWLFAIAEPPQNFIALGEGALERPGLAGEIALRAQIDNPRAYFIALGSGENRGDEAFAAPLYPPSASVLGDPVSAVLLEPAGAPAQSAFANWVRGVGPRGVIVEFLGRRMQPDPLTRERIALALRREGLRLAADAAFVDPHHLPRKVELAPHNFGLGFAAAIIGVGALFGLITLRSIERARRRSARAAPQPHKPEKPDAKPAEPQKAAIAQA